VPERETISNYPCRMLSAISRVPVLITLVLLYALFVLYIFPNSGNGTEIGPLDLKFSYSSETAYEMIAAYGQEGRARYARSAMTVDVAYPIVYTLLFMVWLSLALNGTNLAPGQRCIVSLLPLSVFFLDLVENAGIVALLKSYPDQHETLVTATSLATSAKWSSAILVISLTLTATVHSAWRKMKH